LNKLVINILIPITGHFQVHLPFLLHVYIMNIVGQVGWNLLAHYVHGN